MSAIIGFIGITFCIWFITNTPASGFHGYYDKHSLVLLLTMPPSVILLSHSLTDFATGFQTLFRAMRGVPNKAQIEVIDFLTKAQALVRANGIGALINARGAIKYDLLREGISLIVNDFSVDEIRHNLTNKINTKQTRMAMAASLFESMSRLSPGVGMLGTLLGLIQMMANLKDPSSIGAGMALAMIGTMYGMMLGNVFYGPCAEKIVLEGEKILELDQMVLEGVLGLKQKKSSIHMRDIMSTFGHKGKAGDMGGDKPKR